MSPLLLMAVPAGILATVLLGAYAVWTRYADGPAVVEVLPEDIISDMPLSAMRKEGGLPELLAAIGRFGQPESTDERESWRAWLAQAGQRDRLALERVFATRLILAAACPAVALALVSSDNKWRWFLIALAAAFGYVAPVWHIGEKRTARQEVLKKTVPDMLDMLVNCLEAGLGTDAALRHITRELKMSAPMLADELETLNASVTAGVPRIEALRQLDRRTGIDSLSSLVAVLGQAERFGSGVAQAVRAHADLSRKRRVVDAERRAAEVAPKLTVVMILFILPALFVVLMGPTAVALSQGAADPEQQ